MQSSICQVSVDRTRLGEESPEEIGRCHSVSCLLPSRILAALIAECASVYHATFASGSLDFLASDYSLDSSESVAVGARPCSSYKAMDPATAALRLSLRPAIGIPTTRSQSGSHVQPPALVADDHCHGPIPPLAFEVCPHGRQANQTPPRPLRPRRPRLRERRRRWANGKSHPSSRVRP